MMGLTSVEMRDPKIGDLRGIPNMSSSSIIRKTEFVKLLVGDQALQITPQDRDYLFVIAVSAISMNTLPLKVQCSCGNICFDSIKVDEVEPLRLRRGIPNEYKTKVFGSDYQFRRLNVDDELKIEERAVDLPDEDYDNEFLDGVVAQTLGYGLETEGIERVRDLDLSIYMGAVLFQSCNPHGVTLMKKVTCPQCGAQINTHLPIKGDLLNVDVAQVISRYVSLNPRISMESFFDLTLPEYNTLVKSLNEKIKSKK